MAATYTTMSAARPSHLPRTTWYRLTGRASMARATPDSTSLEIAGEATTTALSASTPLNMNSTSTSTCDVARRSSLAAIGVPSGLVRVVRC